MEMSGATLITRLIAMFMRKSEDEVKKLLQEGDQMALTVQRALNKKLLIVDQNNLSIKDIRTYINIANTMVFDSPTDMIIVDYLQYMPGTSEYTVMSETIRSFKPLAKGPRTFSSIFISGASSTAIFKSSPNAILAINDSISW